MAKQLTCYDCKATYTATEQKRCDCGEPLWFDIDASGFDWAATLESRGVWQYATLLPTDSASDISSGAGETPLIRADRLDGYAGCRLYVKDEGGNPTGSFKDRGSAVGVASAARRGVDWVGTVSHGNMAMSMSAMAAGRGLGCVVLVPARIPASRLALVAQYDPELLMVADDYGQLYYDTLELETPIEFVNSDTPLRIEGQKTVGVEICETFAPDVPDAIVLPVSSGGHASAVWKGLLELRDAGVIDKMPRLYLVQAAACDPIAQAYHNEADAVSETEPGETIAFSIANGSPPSGNRALTAARETKGAVLSVSDDEIRDARSRLAAKAGLCVEPASATTLAGIRKLSATNELTADDRVVAIVTGTGFKELGDADIAANTTTIDLNDLEEELLGLST